MANSPTFVDHALDLLALLGPVRARAMFGGHGLYARGVMFALLDDDDLFLKADDEARPRFESAGCVQFTWQGPKGTMAMGYWRPPDDAHEDAEAMRPWAELALGAALRAAAGKASKRSRATGARPGKKPAPSRPPGKKRRRGARPKRPAGGAPRRRRP